MPRLDKRDFPGATFPEWLHLYTSTRLNAHANETVKVRAGLHYLKGNALPYFSVTADIYDHKGKDIGGGACHKLIARLWPKLIPVIALHLSDSDGVPTHAEGNGWYYLAGYYQTIGRYHLGNSKGHYGNQYRTPTPEECLQVFADHVRLSIDDARTLAEGWRFDDDPASSYRWFVQWVETQKPRWETEAQTVCNLLDTLERGKHAAQCS